MLGRNKMAYHLSSYLVPIITRPQIAPRPIHTTHFPSILLHLPTARALAKSVSERGGGLKSVEAMALAHEGGLIEVRARAHDGEAQSRLR